MDRKEYINFTKTNNEPINMEKREIAKWMNEMVKESQSQLVILNQLSDEDKILKQFEILTNQKLDKRFRCFLPFYTDYGKNLQIGKNVFINKNCNFQDRGGIEIHDGALIGRNVNIATLNHKIKADQRHIIYPQKSYYWEKCLNRFWSYNSSRSFHWWKHYYCSWSSFNKECRSKLNICRCPC